MTAEFERVVREHSARYPLMQPQDYAKLAYQSEYGPAHLVTDESEAIRNVLAEWQTVSGPDVPCNPERIGNDFCRFHMTGSTFPEDAAEALARLFMESAQERIGTLEGLLARLEVLGRMDVAGMDAWLAEYRQRGCPPVRHSEAFRQAYAPYYRVVRESLIFRFPALVNLTRKP